MNRIYYPKLNPVQFYDIAPTEIPQYLTKHYDRYLYSKTIAPWEEQVSYYQKWQQSDIIKMQVQSNFSLISFELVDAKGRVIETINAVQLRANKFIAGYYVFEAAVSLATVNEGCYFIQRKLGTGQRQVTSVSNPLYISEVHESTQLYEYKHSRYHGDVIFETGIEFSFRVESWLGRILPGSDDEFYKDKPLNPVLLKSNPFNAQQLKIGGEFGVPDFVVDLINRIWSCNNVKIDGKEYAKNGEAKFTFKDEENYPMRGIEYEVLEGINRGSEIVDLDADTTTRLLVVHNIEGKLFGDVSNQNNNIIQITDIE